MTSPRACAVKLSIRWYAVPKRTLSWTQCKTLLDSMKWRLQPPVTGHGSPTPGTLSECSRWRLRTAVDMCPVQILARGTRRPPIISSHRLWKSFSERPEHTSVTAHSTQRFPPAVSCRARLCHHLYPCLSYMIPSAQDQPLQLRLRLSLKARPGISHLIPPIIYSGSCALL